MHFKPTHIVNHQGQKKKVMLVGEWAYEGHEWAESASANHSFKQGEWRYKHVLLDDVKVNMEKGESWDFL